MEEQNDILKSDSRPAGIGPGERLQAARIKQGLSIDDIANRMHLNVQIVKAIEDNNFDDITAPIFVKGYLRAYARIVGLDEEEMIQQYANYYSHEDPPISTTSNMAPELSVADVRIKWTTYLVILGLAALLAAWWWNKNQDDVTPISLDSPGTSDSVVRLDSGGEAPAEKPGGSTETGPVTAPAPADVTQQQAPGDQAAAEAALAAEPETVDEPAVAETTVTPATAPETVEPQAPAAPPEPAPAPEAATQSVDETGSDAALAAETVSEGEALPSAPESAAESEPAPVRLGAPVLVAPSGSDTLSVSLNADSWVDVKDSNDFQMVYHLLRAGQSLELTGSAPFTVFLGNGPGVELRLNGEDIEFSTRIRSDNTTRLSIGG